MSREASPVPCVPSVVQSAPIYVPFESLTRPVVRSLISVVHRSSGESWSFSQRTVLAQLLAVHDKLEEILKESPADTTPSKEHAIQVRAWLMDDPDTPLNWEKLQQLYAKLRTRFFDEIDDYFGASNGEPYFQLTVPTVSDFLSSSQIHVQTFSSSGLRK